MSEPKPSFSFDPSSISLARTSHSHGNLGSSSNASRISDCAGGFEGSGSNISSKNPSRRASILQPTDLHPLDQQQQQQQVAVSSPSLQSFAVTSTRSEQPGTARQVGTDSSASRVSNGPTTGQTTANVRSIPTQVRDRARVATLQPPPPVPGAGGATNGALDTNTDAIRVRRNIFFSILAGFGQLGRGRRFVLIVRLATGLAQILAFIPILSLGSSHGGSYTPGEDCNPESLFIYLLLHIIRIALVLPCDFYLGLSPHRSPRARRAGPEAMAIRERERAVGSIRLDRKVARVSDMLGFVGIILFVVGNYVVYSSTECSKKPADSIPLFWSAFASLVVTYLVILEVILLAFLVVCALPLLIVILRALGLGHRIPQREIRPETGKVDQADVDKVVKLVYFTPAEEQDGQEEEGGKKAQGDEFHDTRSSLEQITNACINRQGGNVEQHVPCVALPPSRPGTPAQSSTKKPLPASRQHSTTASLSSLSTQQTQHETGSSGRRLSRLIFPRTRNPSSSSISKAESKARSTSSRNKGPRFEGASSSSGMGTGYALPYPLHPLPAHRATCPICLCDFEKPNPQVDSKNPPEPLRLLDCGHVLHKSCVDEWFTTVSGRCPVCQKPVLPSSQQEGSGERDSIENEA